MSQQSFADLGVSTAVVDALAARKIHEPFAVQRSVIGDVLAGRDVLARSPTGSGKTLAFGIPLIDRIAADSRRPAALVLAPTRELATQIVDELRPIAHARALRISAVYGGVGLLKQAQTAAKSHIIVATPGRLEDQLERRAFTLNHVRTLIIDEADRMLDMGFRPALDRIVALCPPTRQTLFFSATLDGEAGRAARRYTNDASFHEHGHAERRASDAVEHLFVPVTHEGRIDALLEHLGGKRDLTLVFVRTKHGADKLVKKLSNAGVAAVAMHGNKTQRQRERALAQFEAFDVDTLVATDVAARGIDVSGISHVINFDPPHDSETYVHRVGRTGRAGATGIAISLVSGDQVKDMNRMVGALGLDTGLGGKTSVGAGGFRRAEKPAAADGTERQGGSYRQDTAARPGGHRSGYPKHGAAGSQRAGKPTAGRHPVDGKPAREGRPPREGAPARSGKPAARGGRFNRDGGFGRDGGPQRDGGPKREGQSGRGGQLGAKRQGKPRFKNS
ncbi:MAG TPA: DEAD/DEAH box helicase [Solirubrobacteraceae bacterium]|jgi:superfamily II DNA/RNA helicase|nr:DEAD/DEAH box helicase [Solirubrobacteraceae bacterium]